MNYTQFISFITDKYGNIKEIIESYCQKIVIKLFKSISNVFEYSKKILSIISDLSAEIKKKTKTFRDSLANILCVVGIALSFFIALVLFFFTLLSLSENKKRK